MREFISATVPSRMSRDRLIKELYHFKLENKVQRKSGYWGARASTVDVILDVYRSHPNALTEEDEDDILAGTTQSDVLTTVTKDDLISYLRDEPGASFKTALPKAELVKRLIEARRTGRPPPQHIVAFFRPDSSDSSSPSGWPSHTLSRFLPLLEREVDPDVYSGVSAETALVTDVFAVLTAADWKFFSLFSPRVLKDLNTAIRSGSRCGMWVALDDTDRVDALANTTRTYELYAEEAKAWVQGTGAVYDPSQSCMLLDTMPDELLVYVFSFLDPTSFRAFATASQRLWRVGHDAITLKKMIRATGEAVPAEFSDDPVALFTIYPLNAQRRGCCTQP